MQNLFASFVTITAVGIHLILLVGFIAGLLRISKERYTLQKKMRKIAENETPLQLPIGLRISNALEGLALSPMQIRKAIKAPDHNILARPTARPQTSVPA